MLKVWGRNNSLNVQKVMWCVGELGLEYERIDVGGPFAGLETPEYLAMNPNGKIPTAEDDENVLWESHSIIRYLSLKYGKGTLCPEDLGLRHMADRWMDWPHNGFMQALRVPFWALVRDRDKEEPDMDAVNTAVAVAEGFLPILENCLANSPYIAGETFTMGDIPLGCILHRWYSLPIERTSHPSIEAWLDHLKGRSTFQMHVMLQTS